MTNLWLTLLVKSTVVLAAGALLAHLLRSRSAAARHLIWLSTLCALLILPLGLLIPDGAVPETLTLRATALAGSSATRLAAAAATNFSLITAIWVAGAVLLLARLIAAALRAGSIVKSSRHANTIAGHAVRFTDGVATPVAWSFGSGALLLPADAQSWSREALGAAVNHESAHLERRDCEALLAAEVACALYWFHPLVWYAAHRLRIEQELAADDSVLRSGLASAEYATHLLGIATAQRRERVFAGAGTRSLLATRVNAILDEKRRRTVQTRRMVLTSIAAVLAIALPLAAAQSPRKTYKISDQGVTPPQLIQKEEPAYTPEAKEAKIQGTVLLSAIIEPDGHVTGIVVKRSLERGLDKNAVEAVGRWAFKPAEKDGVPVPVSCNIEINFRLN